MRMSTLLSRVKPYLFSNSTILLLKRNAGTPVPEIDSSAQLKKISLAKELSDTLMEESEQQFPYYKGLLNKGNICFCALINQAYVGRIWVELSGARLSYLKVWRTILPSDSAYIHGLLVVLTERGKHIAQKLISEVCNYLFEKHIYAMVLSTNFQSLKAFYKCGFTPIKSISVRYFCFIPIVQVRSLV